MLPTQEKSGTEDADRRNWYSFGMNEVSWKDRIENECIRASVRVAGIREALRQPWLRWFTLELRWGEEGLVRAILGWQSRIDGPGESPKLTWEQVGDENMWSLVWVKKAWAWTPRLHIMRHLFFLRSFLQEFLTNSYGFCRLTETRESRYWQVTCTGYSFDFRPGIVRYWERVNKNIPCSYNRLLLFVYFMDRS